MDQDALRAMMPMAFGKQPPRSRSKPTAAPPSNAPPTKSPVPISSRAGIPSLGAHDQPAATSSSSSSSNTFRPGGDTAPTPPQRAKRIARPEPAQRQDDDGLTAEERAENEAALARGGGDAEGTESSADDDFELASDSGDEGDVQAGEVPVTESVTLKDHNKVVSALALDPGGARIATGSYDYDVKLWDFGGMTSSFRPFKSFEPSPSHFVNDVAWSSNGQSLLVANADSQPRVYDREGNLVCAYRKGDMYIRDMKNTNGHVAELTACTWHPHDDRIFATASGDSTVRLWDVEQRLRQRTVVVLKSKERGARTKVTAMAYTRDGATMAVACHDGALHLYGTSGSYSRPNASVELAHERSTDTSCVAWSSDGRLLASRGGDGTVKLWDARMFKRALATAEGLPNHYPQTSVAFSPDERSLVTGTSATRPEGGGDGAGGATGATQAGAIHVLARSDLATTRVVRLDDDDRGASVVRVAWPAKLNQLLASTSSGRVHVYFDRRRSTKGALLAASKRAKVRSSLDDFVPRGPIIVPAARDAESRLSGTSQASKRRKMERERHDAHATRMPDLPISGPGKGGRIGAAATQHVVQSIWKDNTRSQDPREALLKYADEAEADPKWTAAWRQTQPKPIFSEEREQDDDGAGGGGGGEAEGGE